MNVSLTKELEKYVQSKLDTGLYSSASEVVREGLRLLQEQEEVRKIKLKALKAEVSKGVKDAKSGRVSVFDAESIKARGRKVLDKRKKA